MKSSSLEQKIRKYRLKKVCKERSSHKKKHPCMRDSSMLGTSFGFSAKDVKISIVATYSRFAQKGISLSRNNTPNRFVLVATHFNV